MYFFDLRWITSELKVFNNDLDDDSGREAALYLAATVVDVVNQRHLPDEERSTDNWTHDFEKNMGCSNGEDLIRFHADRLEKQLRQYGYDKRVQVKIVRPENREELLVKVVMDLDGTIEMVEGLPAPAENFDFFSTVSDNPDMALMEQYEEYYKRSGQKKRLLPGQYK